MESLKTQWTRNMKLNFLRQTVFVSVLILSLCVTMIVSKDQNVSSAASPNFTNINHQSSDMPDETYFPLSNTPPADPWMEEITSLDLQTTMDLDYPTQPKQPIFSVSSLSVYDVSIVSSTPNIKEKTETASSSTTSTSSTNAATSSSQRSTLQPQFVPNSTQTSFSGTSSSTNTATTSSIKEPAIKAQSPSIPTFATAGTSTKPAISTHSPSGATQSSLPESKELSTTAVTTIVSTSQSSTTTSVTATVVKSRYCNVTRSLSYHTHCGSCSWSLTCKPGDVLVQNSTEMCRISFLTGCKVKCIRNLTELGCCQGYWGANCDECPGGHEKPCNDHGQCQTTNGACLCKEGFSGTACELCEDSNKYGLNCSQDCLCEHGTCNNGALGDGSCDCESGYKGEICDTEIPECENLLCHPGSGEKWRCLEVNETATCICATGYDITPDLTDCIAHNPCNDPVHPCGLNSVCEQTGPGHHKCTCNDDYIGDGIVCIPIDPCQTNRGGCEATAVCRYTGPNKSSCVCSLGYENYISGTGCSLVNACTRTSCDPNAICETTEPFVFSCTCKDEYVGNGTVCYGNILERMKDINNNNERFSDDLAYAINLITKFYAEPLTKHGPFTLFVPNDRAFRSIIRANRGFGKFLEDEDRAMQIMRQHILIGRFRLKDLQSFDSFYTLQGNSAQLNIRVAMDIFRYKLLKGTDRAKILEKDFIASNGVIHIVNNLLTLEPEVVGDKTKSAMALIKLEGTYNRFESLIMSAGMDYIFMQPNITVFAPENGAWDALPSGTLEYLMKDEEGQEQLKVILKNHVFPGVIGITHLINTPYIKSFANVEVKISVTTLGQVRLDGKVNVSQSNIPCSQGLYHHVEGVIVPSYIEQILPNRCSDVLIKEVKGLCQPCIHRSMFCPQNSDIPTNKQVSCRYFQGFGYLTGCAQICNREVKVPKCCAGFYGADCMPCPGGFRNPCNGRGQCSDGMTGTGLCLCDGDFIGTACTQCRQSNVFGPNCTKTCTCLYGQCDDGPDGTGLCKKGSCQQGYQGDNCDQKLVPCYGNSIICHAHAKCFLDNNTVARCQCEVGYEGDGDDCTEIDPCENDDNGRCHQQATCTKVGPGVRRCECNIGWFGDGFDCSPKTPCQNHVDCDPNAKCFNSEPGQYHCVCKVGYKGDGKTCEVVNLCVVNNGGCHSKAICTPLKVGERNCTCPENFVGNGFTCIGTIAEEVRSHPNLTRLAQLMKIVNKPNNLLDSPQNRMTLFAPSDVAMEAFMAWFYTWNRTSYWQDEENVIWFLNFHTIYNDYSTEDLFALEGVMKNFLTLYDGLSLHIVKINNTLRILVNHSEFATISDPAVAALNGYIHIIDKVVEPFLPDDQVPTLNESLASQPRYQQFYQAMQITGVLEDVNDLDEYTVFVPTNDAISQLHRTVNADFMKFYIVPKLVFTPSINDGDMFETSLGPQHKLLMSVAQNSIKVNGVQITRADILLDGGVMHEIDGVLHPILNRCDFNSTEDILSDCGDCTNNTLGCPQGYFPFSPPRVIKYNCTFQRYPDAGWNTIGCQNICAKNISILECCGGYFGPYCKECPGGAENPCSDNGRCNTGLEGNGTCFCFKGFSGPDCGRCDDPNLVQPYCNVTYDSCGYRNGNCSEHAVCNETSNGVSCSCPLGYVGDGYICRSQCEILDKCDPQANCVFDVSKNDVQCTCKQGFYGNGTWCLQYIDPCALENGGCNLERAVCNFLKPKVTDMFQGNASCECKEGYNGDGKLCIGDLMDAISSLPELRYFFARFQKEEMLNNTNVTHILSDHKSRSTVFLPVSTDWRALDIAGLVIEGGQFKLPSYPAENDDGPSNVEDSSTDYEFIEQLETLNGHIINVTAIGRKQFTPCKGQIQSRFGAEMPAAPKLIAVRDPWLVDAIGVSALELTKTLRKHMALETDSSLWPSMQGSKWEGEPSYKNTLMKLDVSGHKAHFWLNAEEEKIFANDVLIVRANIDAINGILHLTEVPVIKYEHAKVAASRSKDSSNSTVIILCVVGLLVVMLVALTVAIIYIKKHHEGFFKIFQRTKSSSESNISFARLNAQEEEEDAFKAPDNARYDNPIFNDPDLL